MITRMPLNSGQSPTRPSAGELRSATNASSSSSRPRRPPGPNGTWRQLTVFALDGELTITSPAGEGTALHAEVPIG